MRGDKMARFGYNETRFTFRRERQEGEDAYVWTDDDTFKIVYTDIGAVCDDPEEPPMTDGAGATVFYKAGFFYNVCGEWECPIRLFAREGSADLAIDAIDKALSAEGSGTAYFDTDPVGEEAEDFYCIRRISDENGAHYDLTAGIFGVGIKIYGLDGEDLKELKKCLKALICTAVASLYREMRAEEGKIEEED